MDIELTLNDYWRILHKRKWGVVSAAAATLVSTVFYTNLQTPVYRAQALVKFEPPLNKLMGGSEMLNFDVWTAIQTQVKILSSRDMAEHVGSKLGWRLERVLGQYQAERVEQSNLITISAVGEDPRGVAELANGVTSAYIDRDLEERSRQARQTLTDVAKRRAEVEEALRELEERRREFLSRHQMTGQGGAMSASLMDLEARRKDLLKKFTPEHPEVLKLEQRIESVKARLTQLPGEQTDLERIVRDVRVHEETFITLSRQLEEAKIALASAVPFVSVVSKAIIPTVPISPKKRLNYLIGAVLGAFLGLVLAFVLENLDISISTIEEIEKILGIPVLSIIPHFESEKRWGVWRAKLLRRQRYPMETFRTLLVSQHRPKSPVIEVYHSLRANIQSQLPEKGNGEPQSYNSGLVLTFTSTGVAEGKTLTAVNFSLAAAQAGLKTLLINADIRRPVLHRIFGLPKQPGFAEVLMGKVPWREALYETVDFLMGEMDLDKLIAFSGIDNFKVMTGWTADSSHVVSLLQSSRLPELLGEMRSHFDLIVLDCPPVLLFVDGLIIGSHSDGVVLVYKAGKMARRALKRAKDQIAASKGNILGVILNDMQMTDLEPRYGYYYDYGHYAKKEEGS